VCLNPKDKESKVLIENIHILSLNEGFSVQNLTVDNTMTMMHLDFLLTSTNVHLLKYD
jgi:hypothetical protein